MNLADLLLRQATDRPGQVALVEGRGRTKRSITYGDLADRSAAEARHLRDAGIGPGRRVLLFLPLSIDLYSAIIAIVRVGAAGVVIDPHAGLRHVDRCAAAARPDAMIAVRRAHLLRLLCPALRRIPRHYAVGGGLPWTRRWDHVAASAAVGDHAQRDPAAMTPDDAALLTFTSGSTGVPKCAIRTHGVLSAQYEALRDAIALEPGQVDFAALPIFALANLAGGLTTVLHDWSDPSITRVTAAPAFLRARAPGDRRLRTVFTGGGPVFPADLEDIRRRFPAAQVVILYGSTEAEPIAHIAAEAMSAEDLDAMHRGRGLLVGSPVPQVALRIIRNMAGEPIGPLDRAALDALTCPPGTAGEILVSGPHVLRGYLDGIGDEETKIRVGDSTWHRTGDAGRLDARGRLWLLGRAAACLRDDQGELYPLEAESVARQDPAVVRAAVVGIDGSRIMLVECARDDLDGIAQRLRPALEPFGIGQTRRVARIPMDRRHGAKIDYAALQRMVAAMRP